MSAVTDATAGPAAPAAASRISTPPSMTLSASGHTRSSRTAPPLVPDAPGVDASENNTIRTSPYSLASVIPRNPADSVMSASVRSSTTAAPTTTTPSSQPSPASSSLRMRTPMHHALPGAGAASATSSAAAGVQNSRSPLPTTTTARLIGAARRSPRGNSGRATPSVFRDWSTTAALLDNINASACFQLLPRPVERMAVASRPPSDLEAGRGDPGSVSPHSRGGVGFQSRPSSRGSRVSSAEPRRHGATLESGFGRAGAQTPLTCSPSPGAADASAVLSPPPLPSTEAPLPSILLIALADMDALQQSFCAHTQLCPMKEQLMEFKRLVAASMRSELTHVQSSAVQRAEDMAAVVAMMESSARELSSKELGSPRQTAKAEKTSGPAARGQSSSPRSRRGGHAEAAELEPDSLADTASQAHDAAVHAALRAAHGYLYGSETVPVGVPAVHLQRARREWVTQYRCAHVQPRLFLSQRRRYEAWLQAEADTAGVRRTRSAEWGGSSRPGSATSAVPMRLCAALRPAFWRTPATGVAAIDKSSSIATTTATAAPAAGEAPADGSTGTGAAAVAAAPSLAGRGFHAASTPPPRSYTTSNHTTATAAASAAAAPPRSGSASSRAAPTPRPMLAAWEVDLYDDLGLTVLTDRQETTAHQSSSRAAVEATEGDEFGAAALRDGPGNSPLQRRPTAASAPLVASSLTQLAAPQLMLGASGDLTQMQLPLPVFVYVISRFLFVAHYAAYFPTGLFSPALIDPFFFPEPAQCTPAYALRAVPSLRREAQRIHDAYAAELADAHRCFPDRARTTELPLSADDTYHIWELLCPPQRQDFAGRWKPVAWGSLHPAEEEALLAEEYADEAAAIAAGAGEDAHNVQEGPLLSYTYARAARRAYRRQLQLLAQHPRVLAEVQRLHSLCEDVAMQFFTTVDTEQKGSITWEAFTNALIEEADVQDHQRKVRERAAHLTRASASVFDRYVVEPLAPTLARLGYTGDVYEVRHSASLVMLEGATDYAICDGAQLGSIHQRFLVRPIEVICKELEGEPRDAFGRPVHEPRGSRGGEDGEAGGRPGAGGGGRGGGPGGYDAALRQRPWRINQRPHNVFVRYEDGRRLQESTALSVLQQLSSSTPGVPPSGGAADEDDGEDEDDRFASSRAHQPAKLVSLEAVLSVEEVTPSVPWPVFIARSNDMLLRLYGTTRAVQPLPEAGVLRCAETVTSIEWAAGGRRGSGSGSGSTSGGASPPTAGSTSNRRRTRRDRISVPRQEYLLLGTRSGTILLVDLYAMLNQVPRIATLSAIYGDNANGDAAPAELSAAMVASGVQPASERIGNSESAWTGYRALAQRTYYGDLNAFTLHSRQVHTPGTLVCSVVASAGNGLVVSSGLDGDVITLRLAYPQSWVDGSGSHHHHQQRSPRGGVTCARDVASALVPTASTTGASDASRPPVRIEVLQRLRVCETGVRYALPIPLFAMLAVYTVTNKVYLYHSSVLPTAPALPDSAGSGTRGGHGGGTSPPRLGAAASGSGARDSPSRPATPSDAAGLGDGPGVTVMGAPPLSSMTASAAPPRLELYDATAPHLGVINAMMVVEDLDQLITVDSSAYVKVWSLRQSQPITSFYAWAPLQLPGQGGALRGGGGGSADAERVSAGKGGGGGAPGSGGSVGASSGGRLSSSGAAGVPLAPSALLRTTKNSIEASVDAADYRQQPCRTAAYSYAGRQLFVLGSQNAAHCYFLSGQSSARAHTEPLRVLLVDTSTVSRVGRVHRRLISLSSADCRLWSLLTGAMELGIRANNAEYRHLFEHRLTGNTRGKTAARGRSNDPPLPQQQTGRGGGGRRGHGGHGNASRMYDEGTSAAAVAAATSSGAATTGEPWRLLPPSVNDVMRAVSARPLHARRSGSSRSSAPMLSVPGSSAAAAPGRRAASMRPRTGGAKTAPSQLLTAERQPHGSAAARTGFHGSSGGQSGGGGDGSAGGLGGGGGAANEDDGLVTSVMRDQNLVLSDIRCACLGPGGHWIGYALLHGDIRLHRSDSGRLLHTFITTPPSVEDLVEAAMQYQHLFGAITAPSAASLLHGGAGVPHSPTASSREGGSGSPKRGAAGVAGAGQQAPARLAPAAYAQAVALVLQQLLSSTTGTGTGGAGGSSPRAGPAMAPRPGEADDRLSRNVHREPIHMMYLEASQELVVVYADGLLRSFTLLSHSTTATRVIVSRTLMLRALEQVRRVLASLHRHPHASRHLAGFGVAGRSAGTGAALTAHELQLWKGMTGIAALDELLAFERASSGASFSLDLRPASGQRGAASAGPPPLAPPRPSLQPPPSQSASAVNPGRALLLALPTRHIEADVVLLATASPPLGLVCLVHASGLVMVMDVLSHGDKGGGAAGGAGSGGHGGGSGAAAVRMRMMTSDTAASVTEVPPASTAAAGHRGAGERAQAGVVVHSFMTGDEVTAATFLGAYPCLVLADRQQQLSFHLVKGSSLVALLGDFAVQLGGDAAAFRDGTDALAGESASQSHLGAGRSEIGAPPPATSPTLAWTVAIDATCASHHALGHVTALTFDALYATVYVGTSQGYVISYLVRRLLAAFQLTPVYLREVNGVDASTYAAELQRTLTLSSMVQPATPSPPATGAATPVSMTSGTTPAPTVTPATGGPGAPSSAGKPFVQNFLSIVFDVPQPLAAQAMQRRPAHTHRGFTATQSSASLTAARTAGAPVPSPEEGVGLLGLYESRRDLFHKSGRERVTYRRGRGITGGGGAAAARGTAPPALAVSTSSEVLIAAAVLHDAVARMRAAAAVASAVSARTARVAAAAAAAAQETQAWWESPEGEVVQDYVLRRCGAASVLPAPRHDPLHAPNAVSAASGAASSSPATTATSAAAAASDMAGLELDSDGVHLLRHWISTALHEQGRLQLQQQRKQQGADGAVAGDRRAASPQAAPPHTGGYSGSDATAGDRAQLEGSVRSTSSSSDFATLTPAVASVTPSSGGGGAHDPLGGVVRRPTIPGSRATTPLSPGAGLIASSSSSHGALSPSLLASTATTASPDGRSLVLARAAAAALTAQQTAEALVQEVQGELLFGEGAMATASAGQAAAAIQASAASNSALTAPGAAPPPHPITASWVECLFTRQVMCTTSRSPLCLLTPPAMLERARRERLDRQGRVAAAALARAASAEPCAFDSDDDDAALAPEWDAYVEGALPDYLADMLNHPGQVLTEVERQALQQRAITALQCRRNGYLCVGLADGGVTLWTPYACARLESLCPSSSLAATLDRLATTVRTQFRDLHERITLERRRLAFEGSLRSAHHTEEEGAARMKERIRAMLMEHHIAQLQTKVAAGAGAGDDDDDSSSGDKADAVERAMQLDTGLASTGGPASLQLGLSRPSSSAAALRREGSHAGTDRRPTVAEKRRGTTRTGGDDALGTSAGTSAAPPLVRGGSLEAELLASRPLLCLLLGIASPAELRARQLSPEDLCFLPFHVRSIASLGAFPAHCYDIAVTVAMRRLRRELVEEADELAREEAPMPTAETQPASPSPPPLATGTTGGAGGTLRAVPTPGHTAVVAQRKRRRLETVYDYHLPSLARAWWSNADLTVATSGAAAATAAAAHSRGPSLMAVYPGALRMLLHRAMEGAPPVRHGDSTGGGGGGLPSVQSADFGVTVSSAQRSASAGTPQSSPHSTSLPHRQSSGHPPQQQQQQPGQHHQHQHHEHGASAAAGDGEYYYVCHALQVAEVSAETQWEVEELSRASHRLLQALQPTPQLHSPPGHYTHSSSDFSEAALPQLPPSSAAAVSAAVERQVRRELEARVAALSFRAVAAALLRNVQLTSFTSAGAAAAVSGRGLLTMMRGPAAPSQGRGGASGLVWVQATLRLQVHDAFVEPLLSWPTFALSTSAAPPAPSMHLVTAQARPTTGGGAYNFPSSSRRVSGAPLTLKDGASGLPHVLPFDGNTTTGVGTSAAAPPAEVFLTELTSAGRAGGDAVGADSRPSTATTRLPRSRGHTQRGGGDSLANADEANAPHRAGEDSDASQLVSLVELHGPYDANTTASPVEPPSTTLPSPGLQWQALASGSGGWSLSGTGPRDGGGGDFDSAEDAPLPGERRPGAPLAPTTGMPSVASRSLSSVSTLISVTSPLTASSTGGGGVGGALPRRPSPQRLQRLLPPMAAHRVPLSRTGSSAPTTRGGGGGSSAVINAVSSSPSRPPTGKVSGLRYGVRSPVLLAATAAPPSGGTAPTRPADPTLASSFHSPLCPPSSLTHGAAQQQQRKSRVTAMQPMTYFSLLGEAGTTK